MSRVTRAIRNITDELDKISGLDGIVADKLENLEKQVKEMVSDLLNNNSQASLFNPKGKRYRLDINLYTDGDYRVNNYKQHDLYHDTDSYEYSNTLYFDSDKDIIDYLTALKNDTEGKDYYLQEDIDAMFIKAITYIMNIMSYSLGSDYYETLMGGNWEDTEIRIYYFGDDPCSNIE